MLGFGETELVALGLWLDGFWAGCAGCGRSVLQLGWVWEAETSAGAGRGGGYGKPGPWGSYPVSASSGTDSLFPQDLGGSPERLWENNGAV